jgi:hypothetical protein
MIVLESLFWLVTALLFFGSVGYPLLLKAWVMLARSRSLEEAVIGGKVADAHAQAWPADRLEVIVCSDGSTDATVAQARAAGAEVVLDLPRGGKVRAQDAGV